MFWGARGSQQGGTKHAGEEALAPLGLMPNPPGPMPKPPGLMPKPAGLMFNPLGLAPKPAGLMLSPSGFAPKPAGLMLNPSGFDPKPAGLMLNPLGSPPNCPGLVNELGDIPVPSGEPALMPGGIPAFGLFEGKLAVGELPNDPGFDGFDANWPGAMFWPPFIGSEGDMPLGWPELGNPDDGVMFWLPGPNP